ncbi:MAG: hypothetical protein WA051_00405 [Minisyncoccia bacterium]
MDTTAKRFVDDHHVGNVLSGSVATGLPTKPEEIDLRFLSMLRMGDTYDGGGDPVDGTDYTAVLYGNQIAWEMNSFYYMCSCEMRHKEGNELYRRMYYAARLHLKIMRVARALYFREKLKSGQDAFYMSEDDLGLLKDHPQFKEAAADYGLELKPARRGNHRVTVTKFYEKPAET